MIEDIEPVVMQHIFTQLSLKCGLKEWKEKGQDAITKELKQLHYHNTFEPVDPLMLSKTEWECVIKSHLFLKLKCNATVKGQIVAGGDKQCSYIPKKEAVSPMASLELVLLTAVIDAHEGWDVTIADMLNAFVQTKLEHDNDNAIVCLQGPLAQMLHDLAPDVYGPFLWKDKASQPILFFCLLMTLYGIMKAVLLYYCCFVADIKSEGFALNPYDPCITNKIVDDSQLTLVWHVDDIKISHLKSSVVDNMIKWLKATYECIFEDGSSAMHIS